MGSFSAVCGIKNSGKTTLTEKIVKVLTGRGMRVAVIKHDGHAFECDLPGKDSFRYVEAGAYGAAVLSRGQVFLRKFGTFPDMEEGPEALAFFKRACGAFPEADVILAEGFKGLPIPKIEIVRSGISRSPASNPEGRFLIVSDLPEDLFSERTLPFENIDGIADAILENGGRTETMASGQEKGEASGMQDFTHFDESGRARMVNVGDKDITRRTAAAEGRVLVNPYTFQLIRSGGMKKGDVLGTAQVAGIMGAKRTSDLIPMCHPLFLSGIRLDLTLNEEACAVDIRAEVSCEGRTGVEMEALTAVSTAALTVYDMCKAVQRDMEITDIRLVSKTGGIHGDYHC